MIKNLIHTCIVFLFVSICCSGPVKNERAGHNTANIDSLLLELQKSYEGVLPWLSTLYNPDQKGFHFGTSSHSDPEKYICAIVPNGQIVTSFDTVHILDRFTPDVKKTFIDFFREKQSPDGYFRNSDPAHDTREYEFLRGQMYGKRMMGVLDFEPVFPLPSGQSAEANFPELQSEKNWVNYLDGLDWSYTKNYRCASHSSTKVRTAIDAMGEPMRSQLIEGYFSYLQSIQSPITGLWGSNDTLRTHKSVSGAMKITQAYRYYHKTVPMAPKILESVIWTIVNDHDVAENYCYVQNPLTTIGNIRSSLATSLTALQVENILEGTLRHHLIFHEKNGGFVRSREFPFLGDGGEPLGVPGIIEPNLNAVSQAITAVYGPLHKLAGKEIPPLPGENEFIEFMNDAVNPQSP